MKKLSKHNFSELTSQNVKVGSNELLSLPEKVLQFGTGVLLRGLCDYAIDDANRKGIFNGRVVVVKSTDTGDTKAFDEQDNLYTICIRGIDSGQVVEENVICSAISRVLSAKTQWNEVLQTVRDPQLQVIISNTTEVGLQLVKEDVHHGVPSSFPGKLLAVLVSRYEHLKDAPESNIVVIPTELISENGKILKGIVEELADYNKLDNGFKKWLSEKVTFCNSLVDRIVTKDPGVELLNQIQGELGYDDELLTMCEDYALWAIEGTQQIENILSFAKAGNGAFVKEDINIFKFLKLHLLNGTHTLSASLAYLAGFETVKEGMVDAAFSSYVERLQKNIAKAIPYYIEDDEIKSFSAKVLDRFRNPYLQHKWINITLQNTLKMRNRNVPVIVKYVNDFNEAPEYMATGFAAFLLFMKPVKQDGDKYYGKRNDNFYMINDDKASYFFDVWKEAATTDELVHVVLNNTELWGTDLSLLLPFKQAVQQKLSAMISNGVSNTIDGI